MLLLNLRLKFNKARCYFPTKKLIYNSLFEEFGKNTMEIKFEKHKNKQLFTLWFLC